MISILIFGVFLGLIQFFRLGTLTNIYDCFSVGGNQHTNNDPLDNLSAVFSILVTGLIILSIYDANFSFSISYFASKFSFIVEESAVKNPSFLENRNLAALLIGLGLGEGGRYIFEAYKSPILDIYYGRFEPNAPRSSRDIRNRAIADICCLVMDVNTRTLKMVETAIGSEFQLNPTERMAVNHRIQQHYNSVGSVGSILRPINKLYGRNSAGGRAFFERLVRICIACGFRTEQTEGRLLMAAGALGISRIETLAILLRLQFVVERTQYRSEQTDQYSNRQYTDQNYSGAFDTYPQSGSQRAQYLATLGLGTDANDKKIKSAYRKFAKKYHPDILQSQNLSASEMEAASQKMAAINAAYEGLRAA